MNTNSSFETPQMVDSENAKSNTLGRRQLGCVLLVVVVLWGFVFPAISETEFQMERQRQIEERGIDPMALFYTDHPSAQEQPGKR